MSRNAVENNYKLFPMFKQNLMDPQRYLSTAHKLKAWMSRDKAYYQSARPWIVEFVETAKRTVARLGGGDFTDDFDHVSKCNDSPYLQPYIELVMVLAAFRPLFIEHDLLARIDSIVSTVQPYGVAPSVVAPSLMAPSTSTPSATSQGTVQPQGGMTLEAGLSPVSPASPMLLHSQSTNVPPPAPTEASGMSYPSPTIPQPLQTAVAHTPQSSDVDVSGLHTFSPLLASVHRSSLLSRLPGPFPATTNVQPGPIDAGGPSLAPQDPPAVVNMSTAAAGPSQQTSIRHMTSNTGGAPVAPIAGPSSLVQGIAVSSGTSNSSPAVSQAKKDKKKKKKVAPTLDFLEADLDWFLEQKKQQAHDEHAGRDLDSKKPVVPIDGGPILEGKETYAPGLQPETQPQGENEGIQPASESAQGVRGHEDSAEANQATVQRLPPVEKQFMALEKANQQPFRSPLDQTLQLPVQDSEQLEKKVNVEVSSSRVSPSMDTASRNRTSAEHQSVSQSAESDLRSNQQVSAEDANSNVDDATLPAQTRTDTLPTTTSPPIDESIGAMSPAVSLNKPPIRTIDLSTRRNSANVSAPTPLSGCIFPNAALSSPIAPGSAFPTAPMQQSLSVGPVSAPSPPASVSTNRKPTSTPPPRVLSNKSPFDNMTRQGQTPRRTVPKLKIQPVRSGVSSGAESPAPARSKSPAPIATGLPAPTLSSATSSSLPSPTQSVSTFPPISATPEKAVADPLSARAAIPPIIADAPAGMEPMGVDTVSTTAMGSAPSADLSAPQSAGSPQPTMSPQLQSPQEATASPAVEPSVISGDASPPVVKKKKSKGKSKKGPPGVKELPGSPTTANSSVVEASHSSGRASDISKPLSHKVRGKSSKGPPGARNLEEAASMLVSSWSRGASLDKETDNDAGTLIPPAAAGSEGPTSPVAEEGKKRKSQVEGSAGAISDRDEGKDKPARKKRKSLAITTPEVRREEEKEDVDMTVDVTQEAEDVPSVALALGPVHTATAPPAGDTAQATAPSESQPSPQISTESVQSGSGHLPVSLSQPSAQFSVRSPEQVQIALSSATTPLQAGPATTNVVDRPNTRASSGEDMEIDSTYESRETSLIREVAQPSSNGDVVMLPPQETTQENQLPDVHEVDHVHTGHTHGVDVPGMPEVTNDSNHTSVPSSELLSHDSTSEVATADIHPPGTILHTSTNSDGGITFQGREYTTQSFTNGDFVYPHRMGAEEGGIPSQPAHLGRVDGGRELGGLSPIMSVKSLADSTVPEGVTTSSQPTPALAPDLPQASSTAAQEGSSRNLRMTWEVKVALARGIPIVNPPPPPDYDAVHFNDAAKVLAFARGANWHEPLTWEFEISEEVKKALEMWVDRYQAIDADVSSAKCLSLSCYKFSRCLAKLDVDPELTSAHEMFSQWPDVWDWAMHAWAELNDEKIGIWPIAVTEDQLRDVSGGVRVGKNTIKINYPYGNPLDWVYVLRLHDPTEPQLDELRERRKDELRWKEALADFPNFKRSTLQWPPGIAPVRKLRSRK